MGHDESLLVLSEGVRIVARFVRSDGAAGDAGAAALASTDWQRFERWLADLLEHVTLVALQRRYGLSGVELRLVLAALAGHGVPGRDSREVTFDRAAPSALTLGQAVARLSLDARERAAAERTLSPDGRLVACGIVALGRDPAAGIASTQPLRLTTPAVRFLLEQPGLGPAVAALARWEVPDVPMERVVLPEDTRQKALALARAPARYRALVATWGMEGILPAQGGLVLVVSGAAGSGKTLLARALATASAAPLIALDAADLPKTPAAGELEALLGEVFTEATLRDALVLVEGAEDLFGKADPRRRAALRALEAFPGLAILTTVDPAALDPTLLQRAVTHLRLGLPSAAERRRIWEAHLPPSMPRRGALDLDALANRFDFHGATIRRAVAYAVNAAMAGDAPRPEMTTALLEEGCRVQLEQALDGLTIRSTTHLSLDDLVLAPAVDRRVRELLSACRHQSLVMTAWGLGERLTTGRGITALFDGPPGTGKTYAAEILAGELDRPLHRVNLPEVMSKWLGETEKHVQALFQQARVTHAMLLFDEADSLFGQRVQETKSASDRSANMVVNLLLQEVERFPGIAIMTTNLVSGLDPALMRRIQFRITFAEPDQRERLGIWRVLCPARLPLAPDVDFARLAQHFELSGGRIKNALLRAAYRAVDRGGVVSHELLAEACRDEYVAAGKLPRAD